MEDIIITQEGLAIFWSATNFGYGFWLIRVNGVEYIAHENDFANTNSVTIEYKP